VLYVLLTLVVIKAVENTYYPEAEFERQWFMDKIYLDGAWDITNGSSSIVIAVIDSGIDFTHPDIAHAQWINTGEIADNAIDDDSNGYIDDTHGWDFCTLDGHTPDNEPGNETGDPIHWHGTGVTGIIAAAENGVGIVGIAQDVKIMDCRVVLQDEPGAAQPPVNGVTNAELGNAILYAVDNGADIICLAHGFWTNTSDWYDDIVYAYNNDVPVVSVIGNTWLPDGGQNKTLFPGGFDEVIAVGATNINDAKADYSNYGPWLELVAPVGDQGMTNIIRVPQLEGTWSIVYGTTWAAAQVAGAIGLMKSVNDSLTIDDIREILHYTATDLGDEGKDDYFGYGLLNVEGAVVESQERYSYEFPSTESPSPTDVSSGLTFIIGGLGLCVMAILIGYSRKKKSLS
jgi:subtilisin family serine protease